MTHLSLILGLSLALPAQASTPESQALDWLEREAPTTAMGHKRAIDRVTPWVGGDRVRVRHMVHGLPVIGSDAVVQMDAAGQVKRVSGRRVVKGDLNITPTFAQADAHRLAQQVTDIYGDGVAWLPRSDLAAFLDRNDELHLVWNVAAASATPFRAWRVLVDAHDGEVLRSVPTSFDAQANVFPSNPNESTLTEVELAGLISDTTLAGEYTYVVSCDDWADGGALGGGVCNGKSSHAVPDADGNYLFQSDPSSMDDPLAEVQMYHHLDLVSAWFDTEVGFKHSQPIEGVVNFSMANAFFGDADGDGVGEVAFGQTGTMDFAYDADVIYHEFVHSVVGQVTNLGFFGADEYGITFAPLALNEGSADLFSMMLTMDPLLGSYAGSGFGLDAIRDLEGDRSCPNNLYGESHEDGMIWGAMGWNIIEDSAVGPEVAMQLFYGAVSGWPSDMNWDLAGLSVIDAADDLLASGTLDQGAYDAIVTHVEAAGVVDCKRVISLDDGQDFTLFTQYIGVADLFGHVPTTAQFSLTVPEGSTQLKFRIKEWNTAADMGWTIFVRKGEHVRYDVQDLMGFPVPVVADYDFSIDGEGKGNVTLPSDDGELLLEAGETYYFSVAARNLGGIGGFDFVNGEVQVSGSVDCCDDLIADAGSDGDEAKKGCGCASGAPAGWLAVGLAALVVRRRRRSPVACPPA